MEKEVISLQPRPRTNAENFVMDMDTSKLAALTCQDLVSNFVEKVSPNDCTALLSNRIDGRALLLLQEEHLKAMGIKAIGGKVYLFQLLAALKNKLAEDLEQPRPLWSGEMSSYGCGYSTNWLLCLQRYVPPCFSRRIYWEVTQEGVYNTEEPFCRTCCDTTTTEYIDYKYLKEVKLKEDRVCCGKREKLEMYVMPCHSATTLACEKQSSLLDCRTLIHPDAPLVEKVIREAWNSAKSVAGKLAS